MTSVIFLGLNIGAWITIISVLAMFLTLLFTKLREDVAFLLVIAVLLLTGVLLCLSKIVGSQLPA